MTSTPPTVHVSGAGTAGLAAAITAARGGAKATVYERRHDVGRRYHGDFQGLENWTTDGDAIDELASLGIEPTFKYTPYNEVVLFDPDRRDHLCRDEKPIFYLVERGPGDESLDQGLRRQALSLGVDLQLDATCRHLPDGGIVADGPKRADVIAVGYLFETDAADGAYCALSRQLASKGYAYLLVHAGRGVIATCLFDDFHNEYYYLGQTVAFFESALGITMRHLRRFGGAGNYAVPATARKGRILYAGECAGFQDALAGFGMRYALLSGHLAARTLVGGEPERYDDLWRARFEEQLRASMVNRYLYGALGNGGPRRFIAYHAGSSGGRARLKRRYALSIAKALFYPIACRSIGRRALVTCTEPGCNCTWCRCHASLSRADSSMSDPNLVATK